VLGNARGMFSAVKSELIDAGLEFRECGRDALQMASAIPETAAGVRRAVREEVSSTVDGAKEVLGVVAEKVPEAATKVASGPIALVEHVGSRVWSSLDYVDTLMQRALLDQQDPEAMERAQAPVLEWAVTLQKRPGEKVGMAAKWLEDHPGGPVVVTGLKRGDLLDRWNARLQDVRAVRREGSLETPLLAQGLQVSPGDFLVTLNGVSLVGCSNEEKRKRLKSLGAKPSEHVEYVLGFVRVLADGKGLGNVLCRRDCPTAAT